ncbi:MAG: hypothetical protein XD66_0715 [Thermacetogenium phaeum]|jgi:general secretion pathway protein G|uniref:Type II secretion system protein GspG C-terminal domain-containing protein n=1 Tax=Thermacetogenium phaeum TaxID=85874 RepID=A0A101FGK5_9THEO|nr:MAG: hypothetical protein XD66_0715 [Thermacetogenium phaeum]
MLKKYLSNEKGFTMIEMMVVLIIIAVLIGGGIKFYKGYIENSQITKAKAQINVMQAALDAYYADNGRYPEYTNELLDAGIAHDDKTATTEIELEARDPWGQNYKYAVNNNVSGDKSCVVYTGYNNIQGQSGRIVAAESKNGKLLKDGARLTNDYQPDGVAN